MVGKSVATSLHDVLKILPQIFELYDQLKELPVVDQQQLVAVELGQHFFDLIDGGIVSLEEGKPHFVLATTEHPRIDLGKHEEAVFDVVFIEDADDRIDVVLIELIDWLLPQLLSVQVDHNVFDKLRIHLKSLDQELIPQQGLTGSNVSFLLHQNHKETLEGEVVVLVEIESALAVVDLSQNFIGKQLQFLLLQDLLHVVPIHLLLHHPEYHLLTLLQNLAQIHADSDASQRGFLLPNLLDADKRLEQRSAIERKGDVFQIGDDFIEPCLFPAAPHSHLLHDGVDHHLEHLVVALVEVLLLVVELVQHDLEVCPRGTPSLEEAEHALEEKISPSLNASLVDGLYLLQQENTLLGPLLLEVNFEQFVLPQLQEGPNSHEILLLRGVEGAEGEVQCLVEAKPASEMLGQHGVALLDKVDELVQLLSLE